MRRFHKQPEPEPQSWVRPPWYPPEAELPAIVPITTLECGRSEQAAIAITGMSAYARGFEIFVTRLVRPSAPGMDSDPAPNAPQGIPVPRQASPMAQHSFQMRFADGSMANGERLPGDAEPTGPILWPHGGGGSAHYLFTRWWAWPLPPSGPLEFLCQWSAYGITETRVSIDAQLILDAARQSLRLWPEDGN